MADPTVKIGLSMPVWKRPNLTRSVARWHANLDVEGVTILPVAVVTRKQDRHVVAEEGFTPVLHDNTPLTEKHNEGFRFFEDKDVDAVVHLNSDDYLSANYFRFVAAQVRHEYLDCYCLANQHYITPHIIPSVAFVKGAKPGSGTCIRAGVLDRIDWEPWPVPRDRHLDKLMINTIRNSLQSKEEVRSIQNHKHHEAQILGIKSGSGPQMWSLGSIADLSRGVEVRPLKPYLQRHYCKLLEDPFIQSLCSGVVSFE